MPNELDITDDQLITMRDDIGLDADTRIKASAALSKELPRDHGVRVRCRQYCTKVWNARYAR